MTSVGKMSVADVMAQMAELAKAMQAMQAIVASLEVAPEVAPETQKLEVEPANADDPTTWTKTRLLATVSKAGGPKWAPEQSLEKVAYAQGWNYHWLLTPIRGKNKPEAIAMRKTFGTGKVALANACYAVATGEYKWRRSTASEQAQTQPKADKKVRETRENRTKRLHLSMPEWAPAVRKAYADGGVDGLNEYRQSIKYETCGCGTRTDKVVYMCKYAQTLENPEKVW